MLKVSGMSGIMLEQLLTCLTVLIILELKQKGNAYYKRKKYGEAIESYMKALDLAPFNVAVLANIAQCYLRQDNVEDCIEFCTRTLYIDPNHVKALSRRANVWHKQSKLKEAAEDMKKALVLDPENPDVIEQHSIVVGDYEDFAKKSFLEATIRGDSTCKQTLEVSAIQELRFVQEIFDQINKQVKNAEASSLMETEASDSELCTTSTSDVIQWQWAAYELLLPFVERSEDVRDHLRTSGELFRLCDRLCGVFGAVTLVAQNPSMNMSAKSKDRLESESIVSAMLNCVAATVADSSRNQVVLFRQTAFREYILEAVSKEHTDVVSGSDHRDLHNILASPLIQASIARVLEEVIDSKAWKNAVLSSRSCLNKLFEILKVEHVEKQMPKSHLVAITNRTISASSICFTLSNDAAGINTLVSSDDVGDRIIVMSKSIQAFSASDSPTLKNLLGLVTNLTTVEAFRVAIEAASRENERKLLVESLLSIAHRFFTVPVPAENSTSERALAALLNLSFHDYSQVRQKDLLEMNTIDVLLQMFANIQPEALPTSICVVSRASSLLCRLHVARYIADKTSKASECEEKLSSNPVLIELVRICKCIITSYKNPSEEIWQICAQIWCHFGWCAHLATVRSFLRQENAVSFLLKAIAVANDRSPYRNQLEPAKKNGSSTERLVGNIAKVLIALESDHTENDYTTFSKERNLGVLVTALQHLPDGLARKNVAILLAKLCQHDSSIKDTVRSLRGIEMMLSISQALQKTSGNTTARDPKALSA